MLALNLGLALSSASRKSVTVDEFALLPTGVAILEAHTFQIDRGVPPLAKVLTALPVALFSSARLDLSALDDLTSGWTCGYLFLSQNAEHYHADFMSGRYVSILTLLATGLLCYGFARSLYGPAGALVTAVAVSLSPNLLAHGRLVTTDIYLTAAVMGALWAFDALLRKPGPVRCLVWGLTLGAAALCKFTGALLLLLLPAAGVAMFALRRSRLAENDRTVLLNRRTVAWGAAALGVALVVMNLGYLFDGSFTRLKSYEFATPAFQSLQRALPSGLPVPLPYDYILGLDTQLAEQGYDAYLLGRFNQTGFLHYFAVGFLVKTPIPILVFAVAALVLNRKVGLREVPLLTVGAVMLAFFSIAGHKNIGIRYLLFLIPMTCVWIGRIATAPAWASPIAGRRLKWAAGAAAAWLLLDALLIWPDYLAYFNLAAGGPSRGHRYLLDSNLDWGQDLIALHEYMNEKRIPSVDLAYFGRVPPEVYGIRYQDFYGQPTQRWVVISANLLWGRMYYVNGKPHWPPDRDTYAAFRKRQPKTVLGHTLYVYDLTDP